VDEQVRNEELAAAVIVPEGFSARVAAGDVIHCAHCRSRLAGRTDRHDGSQPPPSGCSAQSETAQLSRETIEQAAILPMAARERPLCDSAACRAA
jgi:hypothetical protein